MSQAPDQRRDPVTPVAMTDAAFAAACAALCPHCAAEHSNVRFRPESLEYVHDYSAAATDIDTPGLAQRGGPARLRRGTYAHAFCQATPLRLERKLVNE